MLNIKIIDATNNLISAPKKHKSKFLFHKIALLFNAHTHTHGGDGGLLWLNKRESGTAKHFFFSLFLSIEEERKILKTNPIFDWSFNYYIIAQSQRSVTHTLTHI